MLSDKNILIIGGTGTLGQAVLEILLKENIRSVRVYARHEHTMHLLRQKYGEHSKIRYIIGDIRDKERLSRAMENIDTCFNFAALKHVWSCEEQPFECLKTNVIGVQNAIDCAIEHNIKTFIQMSTDKAVSPMNVYGCSKAMAEHLVLNAQNYQGDNRTRFIVVRSGNILGSSGSVLEIWQKQKEQGLPLTVTDINATRYAAPKEKISKAVVDIAKSDLNGLVVLGMKEYSIKELLADFGDCDIVQTGLKPFEKLHEQLYRENEKYTVWEVR
jgi:FlaA1/EpsC-like NDP-sugar epimerase